MSELQSWEEDPALYLFTSLTAGSSHIITATSRIETILKNARIPFSYIDTATNESARKLYGRRGRNKKLPLLVKEGFVIADLAQVEEWNEFGELQQNIGDVPTTSTSVTSTPAKPGFGSPAGSASGTPSKLAIGTPQSNASSPAAEREMAERQKETASIGSIKNNPFMRQLASEAAGKAKGRTFGAPKPAPKEPLQDTTNAATQPAASASMPTSPPSDSASPQAIASPPSDSTSPQAIASPSDVALPSPKSPSRQSSSSSRHASFVPDHPSAAVLHHRGSEISLASEDEIKEIEKVTAIPEEDEGDDAGVCLPTSTTSASKTSASAAAAAQAAPSDAPDAKAHDAIAGLDGAADDPPAPKKDEPANLQDLEKKLERVGTDLGLMQDAQGVTGTSTSQSLRRESHADTPSATSPIDTFEASLSRAGTNLSLLEEGRGLDAEQVTEEELKREDHADTPAATSPIEKFEASLSRSGTGLDKAERRAGVTSEEVLEGEMRMETSIGEQPKDPAAVEQPKAEEKELEQFEESLDKTGTGLDQVESKHGVDAGSAVEGEIKKEEHVPVSDETSGKKEDAKEAEKAGESVGDS